MILGTFYEVKNPALPRGCCGRVHWLLGEGQQLPWQLWAEHLTMITQTMFAPPARPVPGKEN